MELASLQLLICLVQVIWLPEDGGALRQRAARPMDAEAFAGGVQRWEDMFCLDHPDAPFLQVKGVVAKDVTGMDKLLAGLTGATNCAFVNEPGQGATLCGGCAAIALFNQANNAPSFGGGFKSGLRGGSPVTTLIQGYDLRTTVWLNVLTGTTLNQLLPSWRELISQPPTWQAPIKAGETIPAARIGLLRGLFWQPDHIELCPALSDGQCSGCGLYSTVRYDGFFKAKFNFKVEGVWPHPHSPRLMQVKKGEVEEKFLAFTTSAPSWTQISRMLVAQVANKSQQGQRTAAVIEQLRELWPGGDLRLIVGGYRNNQASVLERRHEVLAFNQGWERHVDVIQQVVALGMAFKSALRKALYVFAEGIKKSEIKGAGVAVHEVAETRFFHSSELLIPPLLASLDFDQPQQVLQCLQHDLDRLCIELFEQVTAPYVHHPKLVITLAVARRILRKQLSELKPQGGAKDGQAA
jgi:CRISPR system Cascade subunit CasA